LEFGAPEMEAAKGKIGVGHLLLKKKLKLCSSEFFLILYFFLNFLYGFYFLFLVIFGIKSSRL